MYPVVFTIPKPEKTSRLKMLFRFILIIPAAFFSGLYSIPVSFVIFIAFWAVMFTARNPKKMWEYVSRYFRFNTNINAYTMLLTDMYPPFNGKPETLYPIKTAFQFPEKMSRLTVFFRWLLLLPHYFYIIPYSIGYVIVGFLTFWAVLVRGRIPESFFQFIKGFFIYQSRLNAYIYLLVDEYPPFNGLQSQAAMSATPL